MSIAASSETSCFTTHFRYKKDFFFAAKFESGAMRFSGKKSLRRWSPFKTTIPPLSFCYKEQ